MSSYTDIQIKTDNKELDSVTKIYNHSTFYEKARKMIDCMPEGYYTFACINISGFKVINEQYGIDIGDEVLINMAKNLQEGLVDDAGVQRGICGRNNADDFLLLYPSGWETRPNVEAVHMRICAPHCLKQRIHIRVGRYRISNLTLSMFAIYSRAKLAADVAKGHYRKYIAYYTEDMREKLLRRYHILNNMVDALREDEFEVYVQPQFDHATGKIIGAEALARWKHNGEMISPGEFVPIFEETDFVYELDKYMWEKCCKIIREQMDAGFTDIPLSFNISRFDLLQEDFPEVIANLVKKYNIPLNMFKLEITESTFENSTKEIIKKACELVDLGFTVAIDDFGSGYSSLNLLKDIPAKILKLDLRFFEDTENNSRADTIVRYAVDMAKGLHMTIISEGVEKKEQADYLLSIGSRYIQGYLYAKPMPLTKYRELLESNHT